jgi:hypothetical protein
MRRVVVIAVASLGLAGCSSFSMDAFKPTPPTVQVQLDSVPPGADAKTSVGPGCKTPCSVAVTTAGNFTVTYTMNKFQPATIPVQVTNVPGDFATAATTTLDPNPVVAELQPEAPPKKPARRPTRKPRAPKTAAAPAAAAPASDSPFPQPEAPAPAAH